MTTLDELCEVLLGIYSEIGNLSIQSDGEVRRRLAEYVLEARELIAQLAGPIAVIGYTISRAIVKSRS